MSLKVAFVFSHRFHEDSQGRVWSTGQFPSSIWKRYLEHFNEIIVVARLAGNEHGSTQGLVLSSHPGVLFRLLGGVGPNEKPVFDIINALMPMARVIRECDAVIVRTSLFGLAGALMAERYGKPWAIEVVGCAWDALWNERSLVQKAAAPIIYMATRLIVARARFVIYVTEHFLQMRYPAKQAILSVACSDVELQVVSFDSLQRRLHRIRQRPTRQLRFGLIGTLKTRYKGIQTVFRALTRVRQKIPDIEFCILGSGPTDSWKRKARQWGVLDIVRFDGLRPPGAPVLAWLDDIDIYLQPSFQEGLPRALIEAMSRACPALGSTCGGIPELLDAENLIKPGDQEALAHLMIKAGSDRRWQETQAESNWMRSQDYLGDKLNKKRSWFWREFAKYARSNG